MRLAAWSAKIMLEEELVALLCIESTITARDSKFNSLSRVAVVASNLLEEEVEEQ